MDKYSLVRLSPGLAIQRLRCSSLDYHCPSVKKFLPVPASGICSEEPLG